MRLQECGERYTIASAINMYVTRAFGLEEPNPLEMFEEEYADRETLIEMWHDMVAEESDDCDCEECAMARELDDDSMPDLEGSEDSD